MEPEPGFIRCMYHGCVGSASGLSAVLVSAITMHPQI